MKKAILLLMGLLLSCFHLYAQKHDFNWPVGYSSLDNPLDTTWGISFLRFNTPDGRIRARFDPGKTIDLTVGVRVSNEDESAGLDISQQGEERYNMDMDLVTTGAYTYGGSGSPIVEPAMRTADALEK